MGFAVSLRRKLLRIVQILLQPVVSIGEDLALNDQDASSHSSALPIIGLRL